MVTINCLTRALDQWNSNRDIFRLYYNSNHVISLEKWYCNIAPVCHIVEGPNYLPLDKYGSHYFASGFNLSKRHLKLLAEYFNYIYQEHASDIIKNMKDMPSEFGNIISEHFNELI